MLKYYSMLNIRPAVKNDARQIKRILAGLDFTYQKQLLKDFWVAEEDKKILGIVQLKKGPDHFFIESLGVIKGKEKQGIASALLKKIFSTANKDIYLYTIIPEFFKKFGFETVPPPSFIPPRTIFECAGCFPEKCLCMVRPHG